MVKKYNDFPDDIINFEDLFQNDYEDMNKFMSFFKKVQEVFDSFNDVKIKELNLSKIIPETSDILPFTYIITINSKEYLLFLINESKKYISKAELLNYENLFTYNPSQVGIIIVWNDSIFSSLKLYRSEIYKQYEEIMEILSYKERLLPLEELLNKEIGLRERFLKVIVLPTSDDKKAISIPNLEKELYSNIEDSYNFYRTRKFREPKKSIMGNINFEDFKPIFSLFEKFITQGINIEEMDEIIKLFKLSGEEK